MSQDQIVILAVLCATVGLFLWGRWRHDMVAAASLLACVVTGLVPSPDAFAGFGHPAVVTVAAVLVLSRGLQLTGAVDALAQRLLPSGAGPTITIAALTALAALLSAFMNNVGALALLIPVALQVATKQGLPPGQLLMPLAFGSILGGMTTLIGTPPNLIVSGFRAANGDESFGMFDFTPVGLAVAATGVAFVALVGWRLVPAREQAGVEGFDTGLYLTEVRVTDKSKAAGLSLRELGPAFDEADAQVVGFVRHGFRVSTPEAGRVLAISTAAQLGVNADPFLMAVAIGASCAFLTPIGHQNLDEGHADLARSHRHLGVLLRFLGDLPGSERELRRALDIDRARPAVPGQWVAADLHDLGRTLTEQGQYSEGERLFRESLAVRRAPRR